MKLDLEFGRGAVEGHMVFDVIKADGSHDTATCVIASTGAMCEESISLEKIMVLAKFHAEGCMQTGLDEGLYVGIGPLLEVKFSLGERARCLIDKELEP